MILLLVGNFCETVECRNPKMKQNEVDETIAALLREASLLSTEDKTEAVVKKVECSEKVESSCEEPVESKVKASVEDSDNSVESQENEQNIAEEISSEDGNRAIEELTNAAKNLAEGKIGTKVKMAMEGVLGDLAGAINQTMLNIQQMDSSLKESQKKIPNLTEQLDSVSAETETAANNILNKLDDILNISDEHVKNIKTLNEKYEDELKTFGEYCETFESFRESVSLEANISEEERLKTCQNVSEFFSLFSEKSQKTLAAKESFKKSINVNMEKAESIQNTVLDIFNEFQFQDISRQKIQRIILLIRDIDTRIERLFVVFNIKKVKSAEKQKDVFRVSEHIESVSLEKDSKKEDVDDIVGNFFSNS